MRSTVVAAGVTSTRAGLAHHGGGDLLDGGRHGGGKKKRLPLGRQLGDDPLDLVHEAEVEHAVGLVEDEDFHLVERDAALVLEVHQAARRGDEDIHAAREGADLRGDVHAAEDGQVREVQVPAVVGEALADLRGEFARGREDERAGALRRRRAGMGGEPLQDRQREGGRLAGAGLGDADQVAALRAGAGSTAPGWARAWCSFSRAARAGAAR